MARLGNPLGFTPLPVIIVTSLTYIALFAALLTVHLTVPDAPSSTPKGINLTEAWQDLQAITQKHHPYNSRANDEVRMYLSERIKSILASKEKKDALVYHRQSTPSHQLWTKVSNHQVLFIDDNVSNVTFSETPSKESVYFEGTNIIVAIRGTEDKEPLWTDSQDYPMNAKPSNSQGVLVNAHYDSVSTSYGATDDGVGIVTILQLLSYFTDSEKNWPKRTIILLMNNGEEDFLNGARAFMRHPISRVPHTFLNLEGAGAGGRATLFRSTDTEVTKYYKAAEHPFGTVASSDGFKQGFVRSQTDYVVFNGELGLRGLDVAFMEPRARYHTIEDSIRETSLKSVWHMLSQSLTTVSGLASDTSSTFSGSGEETDDGKVDAGSGSDAVWFDMFGKAFVVFRLYTFFALCVTVLTVAPITLIILTVALAKLDKFYPFSRKQYVHSSDDDQPIQLNGWRGVFRFPITFVVSTAAVVGLAYLNVRVNPLIAYSSPYAVWSMMMSAWFVLAWFLLRGADAMRPTALQRMYSLIWMYCGAFVLLVLITVAANNYDIAGGYFALFYYAAVFFALLLSYIELFFLPKKSTYVGHFEDDGHHRPHSESASRPLSGTTGGNSEERPLLDDDATETTSLLRGDRRSFARYGSRRQSTSDGPEGDEGTVVSEFGHAYIGEQEWSGKLPGWLWTVQFVLLAPINIILIGQLGLIITSALQQTSADGSPALTLYLAIAIFSALIAAPLGPFIHRFTYHIPTFLFFVCVGTVIYNLVAFPFSRDNRLKVFFLQQVDCDTGKNTVSLTGLDDYIRNIIADIPSAKGEAINCTTPRVKTRKELTQCAWTGLPPHVGPSHKSVVPYSNKTHVDSWLRYNVTSAKNSTHTTARFHIQAQDTRACRIYFDTPITHLSVDDAAADSRFNATGANGSKEVRLWHREWSKPWHVNVGWHATKHGDNGTRLTGSVVCMWSDANSGAVPAFDEVLHYMPVWSTVTKMSDGLVEGSKKWEI